MGTLVRGTFVRTIEATASPDSGYTPVGVSFDVTSSSAFESVTWYFGDGATSNDVSPRHSYNLPGRYQWVCRVYFSDGSYLEVTGWITIYDFIRTGRTHVCLRRAIPGRIEQGIGWSIYSGDDWPYPVAKTGRCKVIDESGNPRQLVIDGSTFEVHELGIDGQWKDREGSYTGSDVEAQILLKEEVPPMGASAKLQHEQSHAYIKPYDKEVRNTGEYNSEGFREDFSMDAYIRVDGAPTNHAITSRIPFKGQLVFDRMCKSENLQIGWSLRAAPWRFVKTQTWYRQIDSSAAPDKKQMTEKDLSLEWTTPRFWIARNINPAIDAATGREANMTYEGTCTGPDQYTSGIIFLATPTSS